MRAYQQFILKVITTVLPFFFLMPDRLSAQPGTLDKTFGTSGITVTDVDTFNDYGFSLAIQKDGKILVAGIARLSGKNNDFGLIRYKANGTPDSSFGVNGIVTTDVMLNSDDHAYSVCLQKDGKIIAAGKTSGDGFGDYDFAVLRYNTDGSVDSSFGINGRAITDIFDRNDFGNCVQIQADGKIVFTGSSFVGGTILLAVVRYNSNGSLDSSFSTDGIFLSSISNIYLDGQSLCLQPDGKIVVSATSVSPLSEYDMALMRLNADGSPDNTFGTGGVVILDVCYKDYAYATTLQPDGKILVAGTSNDTSDGSSSRSFSVVRVNSDGSFDNTFGGGDGKVFTRIGSWGSTAFSLALQDNGKIIAVGNNSDGVNFKLALARYEANGDPDLSFGTGGMMTSDIAMEHEYGKSVALQSDGKIMMTGFIRNGGSFDVFVARYIGDKPLSVPQSSSVSGLKIFPNPFSTSTIVQTEMILKNASLRVYAMTGQLMKTYTEISGQQLTLNRGDLPAGNFILQVLTEDGVVFYGGISILDGIAD